MRSLLSRIGIFDRNRGRLRGTMCGKATPIICRNDIDVDFQRSIGFIRTYCSHCVVTEIISILCLPFWSISLCDTLSLYLSMYKSVDLISSMNTLNPNIETKSVSIGILDSISNLFPWMYTHSILFFMDYSMEKR